LSDLSSLSTEELMAQYKSAKAAPDLSAMSTEDLMAQYKAAKPKVESSMIPAAIADVPSEIGSAAGHAIDDLKGFDPRGRGELGVLEGLGRTGKAILGVPELLMSPITGAARSLLGHPLADVTHKVGEIIAPEIAAKDDPKAMYETAKGDVDKAMSAMRPRVGGPPAAVPAPAENGLAAAADRLSAAGSPVEVPQALASDSMAVQRAGQAIRNVPIVGDAIPKATVKLGGQLEDAASNVAAEFGGGSGQNVAHSIGQKIGSAAEREATQATAAAQNSDQQVLGAWEASHRSATEAVAAREGAALAQARQTIGDMSPQDMGEMLLARLRAGEQEARATKDRLYGVAGESDGAIDANAVRGVRARVAEALNADGRVIDGELTPASNRMMTELDNISSLRIPNRVAATPNPNDISAVNMQGIEQTRKRLNSLAQAANNDADRSAARRIVREFDNWLGDAFDNSLFSGSDEALQAFRAARAANTEWRTRFGFNARDDADRIVNRIVTGEVTPQEVSNWVVGATKVGSKGLSSRLLTRIGEATGGDPEAMGAIRGGVWNRLSQSTEGVTGKNAERVANDINEFLSGSGRDVAERLFTEPQRSIMRTYAQTIRQGQEARAVIGDIAANTKPEPMEVGVGPLQKLANDFLGKSGNRSDEALFSAINAYSKSGSKGDINLLSRILQAVPTSDRGNLAGAMIKDMGVSPRTGQFSPDVFISAWGAMKPQAKAILFGMSGPQRQALEDIATISRRMKEVGSRFGNPSGTAQNVNFFALASSAFAAPLTTLSTGLGGAVVAKLLASPIGASNISKWSKAYELLARNKSDAALSALRGASGALAVTINRDTGMPIKDIMQRLQGPMPAAADEKQKQPVRVGN
jgi:hypothetical protein